jgi:hypothetical protein
MGTFSQQSDRRAAEHVAGHTGFRAETLPWKDQSVESSRGDADEANEPGATDRIRIRFRITLVDP